MRVLLILSSLTVGFGLMLVGGVFLSVSGLCEWGQDCDTSGSTTVGAVLLVLGIIVLVGGLLWAGRRSR